MTFFISVRVARTLFLTAFALPTLVVAGWTVARALPNSIERLSGHLSQQFGGVVRVRQVRHPRPWQTEYHQWELLHPVTRQRMVYAPLLQVTYHGGEWGMVAERLEIQQDMLRELAEWADATMLRDPDCPRQVGHWRVGTVELCDGQHRSPLGELSAQIARGEKSAVWKMTLSRPTRATVRSGLAWELDAQWDRATHRTDVTLHCAEATEVSWLASLWDVAYHTGPKTRWRGRVQWSRPYGGPWSARVAGDLTAVDLAQFGQGWNYSLTGRADVTVQYGENRAGSWSQLRATVAASDGTLDPRWIEWIGSGRMPTLTDPAAGQGVAYQDLHVALQLSAHGLTLAPVPLPHASGAYPLYRHALTREAGLDWQREITVTLPNLLQCIAPGDTDSQVPLGPDTWHWLQALPLADSRRPGAIEP